MMHSNGQDWRYNQEVSGEKGGHLTQPVSPQGGQLSELQNCLLEPVSPKGGQQEQVAAGDKQEWLDIGQQPTLPAIMPP